MDPVLDLLDLQRLATARFLQLLPEVPWLAYLGQPVETGEDIVQIGDWESWPGPEHVGADMLNDQLQNWCDRLKSDPAWSTEGCDALRLEIEQVVTAAARQNVAYDPNEDAWHGPTAAVWSAAFLAGLVGCTVKLGKALPTEIVPVWRWFVFGHWPFAYEKGIWPSAPGRMMIL